jgi:hypothetical protein
MTISVCPPHRLLLFFDHHHINPLALESAYRFLLGTTQAVIASKAKQSPSRKEEIASSQKTLLAMTRAEQ